MVKSIFDYLLPTTISTICPEPSSYLLFGLAAAGAAVLRRRGNGTFDTTVQDFATAGSPTAVVVTQTDNDRKPDLIAVSGNASGSISRLFTKRTYENVLDLDRVLFGSHCLPGTRRFAGQYQDRKGPY